MPRVVDHDERRRVIAEALLTVAARDGHEQVSSRAVAKELGMATGALWHYFDGFDDVVRAAATEVTRRTAARIRTAAEGTHGLSRLRAIMGEVLPLSPTTRTEAAVVVGFWGRLASAEHTAESGLPTQSLWQDELRSAIDEAVADGELRADTPRADLLALLQSITYGQQIMQVSSPEDAAHQRVLDAVLAPWTT
ncbi:TetR family transcriptional regulator C-terminal domain-containing protein [Microbacterium sp.]|uniref:TetR/AcrR family transcriptional regulator n=1 Tax=Microbacterium sp. TaxID=51671 RepID=UPI0033414370